VPCLQTTLKICHIYLSHNHFLFVLSCEVTHPSKISIFATHYFSCCQWQKANNLLYCIADSVMGIWQKLHNSLFFSAKYIYIYIYIYIYQLALYQLKKLIGWRVQRNDKSMQDECCNLNIDRDHNSRHSWNLECEKFHYAIVL